MSCPRELITGVVLAGGKGLRMDGLDKGLIEWNGKPLVHYVIEALQSQLESIVISANRNLQSYQKFGYPVISDETSNYDGPLAGMLSAMRHVTTAYILVFPCDAPNINDEVLDRFCSALEKDPCPVYVAVTADGIQPVFSLVRTELADDLQQYLADGHRKTSEWIKRNKAVEIDCSDLSDSFSNINVPRDLGKSC